MGSRRLRLIFAQQRFEAGLVAVLAVALLAAVLVEGLRTGFGAAPAGCAVVPGQFSATGGPSVGGAGAACGELQTRLDAVTGGPEFLVIRVLLQVFPFLAGFALGAPLVAREIEQGTAPLSWALAGSRSRWLLPRLVGTAAMLIAALAVVAAAGDLLIAWTHPGQDPHATFQEYEVRGVMAIGWGLAAFGFAALVGAVLRRSVPAIVVAAIVAIVALAAWNQVLGGTVLRSLAAPQTDPKTIGEADAHGMPLADLGWREDYLYIDPVGTVYLEGNPFEGDLQQWYATHQPADPGDAKGTMDGPPPWLADMFHWPQTIPLVSRALRTGRSSGSKRASSSARRSPRPGLFSSSWLAANPIRESCATTRRPSVSPA